MPNYQRMTRQAARRAGIDPGVFSAQIKQESNFNPKAVSPAGARGIAQMMPGTAKGWHVNPDDPHAALNVAARNMAGYVKQFGSYEKALRAYNAGPGNVEKSKAFGETNAYVSTILGGRHPSVSGVRPSRTPSSTRTTTTTTPGVDNRAARASLIQSFLSGGHGSDPVSFALQARGLRDVKPTSTSHTVRSRGASAGGGGSSSGLHGSPIKELIYNDGGKGFGIKNGQTVDGASFYSGVWAGHTNHVHVGAGPKTTVMLGRLAQKMGLHVGENPHFGGVTQGAHVADSLHYKGEAIDVSSSDKAKMRAFAQAVARYQRRHR